MDACFRPLGIPGGAYNKGSVVLPVTDYNSRQTKLLQTETGELREEYIGDGPWIFSIAIWSRACGISVQKNNFNNVFHLPVTHRSALVYQQITNKLFHKKLTIVNKLKFFNPNSKLSQKWLIFYVHNTDSAFR